MDVRVLLGIVLTSAVCAACESEPEGKPAPSASASVASAPKELKVGWVGKRFRIEGTKARGSFVVPTTPRDSERLSLRTYLYDFPEGTTASIGKQTATTKDRRTVIQDIDFGDKVTADLKLEDAVNGTVDLGIELQLKMPEGKPLTVTAPPQRISQALASELGRIEEGPVKFKGDKPEAGELDGVALVHARARSRRMRVLGAAKTLGDLDWVAVQRNAKEPKVKECPRGNGKARKVRAFDRELKVYNRLDGKLLFEKVFAAELSCNAAASASRNDEQQEVETFLEAELTKRGGKLGPKPDPKASEPPAARAGNAVKAPPSKPLPPRPQAPPPKEPAPTKPAAPAIPPSQGGQ